MSEARAAYIHIREAEFKASVTGLALLHGWLVYSVPDSRHVYPSYTATGYPDLTMVRGSCVVFAELKREKAPRKLSVAQQKWHDVLDGVSGFSAGVVKVYIWRPSDWDEIVKVLTGE